MLTQGIKDACSASARVAVPARDWIGSGDFRVICRAAGVDWLMITRLVRAIVEADAQRRPYYAALLGRQIMEA